MHQKVVLYLYINFVTYIKGLKISIFLALFDPLFYWYLLFMNIFISKYKVCCAQGQKSELFSTSFT
jgi:hypothetical protein